VLNLSQTQKKRFKAIGHKLNPVVTVSENGLSDGVLNEINRALHDHELIKVKIAVADRDDRTATIEALCHECKCTLVQQIGKMALVLRKNKLAKPDLSNLKRYEG
jgi:RNA-binding protein